MPRPTARSKSAAPMSARPTFFFPFCRWKNSLPAPATKSWNPPCLPDGTERTRSMDKMFSLEGKTFLVAGGTRGIGRAISVQFARAGARVIANYVRDERSAQTLKDAAAKENVDLSICRADLTTARGR